MKTILVVTFAAVKQGTEAIEFWQYLKENPADILLVLYPPNRDFSKKILAEIFVHNLYGKGNKTFMKPKFLSISSSFSVSTLRNAMEDNHSWLFALTKADKIEKVRRDLQHLALKMGAKIVML